jgi:hypothetical protein
MSTIVHYQSKNGKPSKATFPNRVLALMFAKNVRSARLEDTTTEVAPVKLTVLPSIQPTREQLWQLGLTEDKRSRGKKSGAP